MLRWVPWEVRLEGEEEEAEEPSLLQWSRAFELPCEQEFNLREALLVTTRLGWEWELEPPKRMERGCSSNKSWLDITTLDFYSLFTKCLETIR